MSSNQVPIVLVHGLWDSSKVFTDLENRLKNHNVSVLSPDLPHKFGRVSIKELAEQLDFYIHSNFSQNTYIDLLGFSMGGLVSRFWLQKLGGSSRTRRFISVGTPHRGTCLAQLIPAILFQGISEMSWRSPFLIDLNSDLSSFKKVECITYFCRWDLMVIPGWKACLPIGLNFPMPVFTHKAMIIKSKALDLLEMTIINEPFSVPNV